MDYDSDSQTPYGEIGPILHSTCGEKPSGNSRPSAAIKNLVSELGLRYRPSNRTDLEAHAAKLALLARDLATIPPQLLRRAVDHWVRSSEFMPTAAELIRLARDELQGGLGAKGHADSHENAVTLANRYNVRLAEQSRPFRWVVGANNELKLEPFDETFAPGKPTPPIPPEAEIIKYAKAVQNYRDGRTKADGTTEHYVDRHI